MGLNFSKKKEASDHIIQVFLRQKIEKLRFYQDLFVFENWKETKTHLKNMIYKEPQRILGLTSSAAQLLKTFMRDQMRDMMYSGKQTHKFKNNMLTQGPVFKKSIQNGYVATFIGDAGEYILYDFFSIVRPESLKKKVKNTSKKISLHKLADMVSETILSIMQRAKNFIEILYKNKIKKKSDREWILLEKRISSDFLLDACFNICEVFDIKLPKFSENTINFPTIIAINTVLGPEKQRKYIQPRTLKRKRKRKPRKRKRFVSNRTKNRLSLLSEKQKDLASEINNLSTEIENTNVK